jgi:hypothetical protein
MKNNYAPTAGRRFGYTISILINFLMIYVANNLLTWNVPFLTERFNECLWAITLSISVSIFIQFIHLFYDPKWFRRLMQAMANVFSLFSTYVFWRVFPLELSENIARVVNLAIIIIMVLTALSIFIELGGAVRHYSKKTA